MGWGQSDSGGGVQDQPLGPLASPSPPSLHPSIPPSHSLACPPSSPPLSSLLSPSLPVSLPPFHPLIHSRPLSLPRARPPPFSSLTPAPFPPSARPGPCLRASGSTGGWGWGAGSEAAARPPAVPRRKQRAPHRGIRSGGASLAAAWERAGHRAQPSRRTPAPPLRPPAMPPLSPPAPPPPLCAPPPPHVPSVPTGDGPRSPTALACDALRRRGGGWAEVADVAMPCACPPPPSPPWLVHGVGGGADGGMQIACLD